MESRKYQETVNDQNLIKQLQDYLVKQGNKKSDKIEQILKDSGSTLEIKDFGQNYKGQKTPINQLNYIIQRLKQEGINGVKENSAKDQIQEEIKEEEIKQQDEQDQSMITESTRASTKRTRSADKRTKQQQNEQLKFNADIERTEQLEAKENRLNQIFNSRLKNAIEKLKKNKKFESSDRMGFDKFKNNVMEQRNNENLMKEFLDEFKGFEQQDQLYRQQEQIPKELRDERFQKQLRLRDLVKQLRQKRFIDESDKQAGTNFRDKFIKQPNFRTAMQQKIVDDLVIKNTLPIAIIKKIDTDLQYKLSQLTDQQLQEFNRQNQSQILGNEIKKYRQGNMGLPLQEVIEKVIDSKLDPLITKNNTQQTKIKLLQPKPLHQEIAQYKKPYFEMNKNSSFRVRQIC